MNKKIQRIWIALFQILFFGCDTSYLTNGDYKLDSANDNSNNLKRQWNIVVYMAADNNLEEAGIEDLLEMELSKLNTDIVSVFVLFDRSAYYDTTNENWNGTRLYRLKTGKRDQNSMIQSQEIDCEELGLYVGQNSELNMSAGFILENLLKHIENRFPAKNQGLIIWGHGTGWRSADGYGFVENSTGTESQSEINIEKSTNHKGFAFDEAAKTYMSLTQLGNALRNYTLSTGKKLSFIGFDTCFGGELEVFYEIRNYADYAVATEGMIKSAGWNYTELFNSFQNTRVKTPVNLCEQVINAFQNEYMNSQGSAICLVDLNRISEFFEKFDMYMLNAAQLIKTNKIRTEVFEAVYAASDCQTDIYTYGSENSDVYLDIRSMIESIHTCLKSENISNEKYNEYKEIEKQVIIKKWTASEKSCGIGVYFSTLATGGLLSVKHPDEYIQNEDKNQIEFVKDSVGYVPKVSKGTGFLDKLFYEVFSQ